jgi:uncharacterized protein (TIGR03435 family)
VTTPCSALALPRCDRSGHRHHLRVADIMDTLLSERLDRNMTRPWLAVLTPLLFATAYAQRPDLPERKPEFEVASVKSVPAVGFHFSSTTDAGTGGPGTGDPETFRCSNCTRAALISRAFELQDYEFPARASLMGETFAIAAKVPAGTTREEFLVMLQGLLKERFKLDYHFENKTLRGYHLILAKGGTRLKESNAASKPTADIPSRPVGDTAHGYGQGGGHEHTGVTNFNGQARYEVKDRTISDLVRMLSNELTKPIDDLTGLKGHYDISLNWASNTGAHALAPGGFGGDHNHAGPSGGAAGGSDDQSWPALLDALQSQLGLKLVAGERSAARVFIVDSITKAPLPN